MLKKTEMRDEIKEKLEAALLILQALRNKSSELMRECEEFKKLRSEHRGKVCSKCGGAIESGHEVVFKGSGGMQTRYYHKECFQELLRARAIEALLEEIQTSLERLKTATATLTTKVSNLEGAVISIVNELGEFKKGWFRG